MGIVTILHKVVTISPAVAYSSSDLFCAASIHTTTIDGSIESVVIIISSSAASTPMALSIKNTAMGAKISFMGIVRKTLGLFTMDLNPFLPISAPMYMRAKYLPRLRLTDVYLTLLKQDPQLEI